MRILETYDRHDGSSADFFLQGTQMLAPPSKKRPGRKAFKPAQRQREQVMTLVAARMTLPEVAAVIGISRSSLCDLFKVEIETGRAKRLAETIEQLRSAAKAGNVSAMRALLPTFGADPQPLGKKEIAARRAEALANGTSQSKWADLLADPTPQGDSDWGDDLRTNYGRFRKFPEN
jgi:hypothetical protein